MNVDGSAIQNQETMIHLVLSSGGMRCISYAGVLSVLDEYKIKPASVSACSAGSLVGALISAGLSPAEITKEILENIDFKRLTNESAYPWGLGWMALFKYPYARFDSVNVDHFFKDVLARYPDKIKYPDPTFAQLQIPFSTVGMDIVSRRFLVYSPKSAPDMKVSEALKIALAVPFNTPPYRRPGRIVVDAGMASECPVWMVADYEKNSPDDESVDEDLPIVALKPRKSTILSEPKKAADFIGNLIEAGVDSRDHYLISQMPRVRMIEIDCESIGWDKYHLTADEKDFLMRSGRIAARKAMETYGEDFRTMPMKQAHEPKGANEEDRAEFEAEKLMMNFNRKLPSLLRNSVFISYAREDAKWMNMFAAHLQPYVDKGAFSVWVDTQIKPGDQWDEKIKQALDSTKVALMLVTPNFLKSNYILKKELKYFLKASQENGLIIFWVAVENVPYEETHLAPYQSANTDPEKALDDYAENEIGNEIIRICRKLKAAVKPSVDGGQADL
jgi:predicted acylesterase/phospholipase RssA